MDLITLGATAFVAVLRPVDSDLWPALAASGGSVVMVVFLTLLLVVHIGFALGVHKDAEARPDGPALVSPTLWAIATLLGGVITAAVYWLLHHSTLSKPQA